MQKKPNKPQLLGCSAGSGRSRASQEAEAHDAQHWWQPHVSPVRERGGATALPRLGLWAPPPVISAGGAGERRGLGLPSQAISKAGRAGLTTHRRLPLPTFSPSRILNPLPPPPGFCCGGRVPTEERACLPLQGRMAGSKKKSWPRRGGQPPCCPPCCCQRAPPPLPWGGTPFFPCAPPLQTCWFSKRCVPAPIQSVTPVCPFRRRWGGGTSKKKKSQPGVRGRQEGRKFPPPPGLLHPG